jgi:2-oxoglutarate ferredoxin oxidoreductase subunit gamma
MSPSFREADPQSPAAAGKLSSRLALQFCGFGGQGIVLSSVVFGTAAVIGARLNVIHTQSYGSESRGGECQAELLLSHEPIGSPVTEVVDILVALSQQALERYLVRLRPDGVLIFDPATVKVMELKGVRVLRVPASELAQQIGPRIVANMVILGFLQKITGLIEEEELLEAIRATVRQEFVALDSRAAKLGMTYALEHYPEEVARKCAY